MMQNTLAGRNGLIVQHLAHHVRKGDRQIIRMGISQADGKTGLGVAIHGYAYWSLLLIHFNSFSYVKRSRAAC